MVHKLLLLRTWSNIIHAITRHVWHEFSRCKFDINFCGPGADSGLISNTGGLLSQWCMRTMEDMLIAPGHPQHLVSQARPNQPQRGSLSVSRTGKEGSGDSR